MTYRAHCAGKRRQRERSRRQRHFWAWVDRMMAIVKAIPPPDPIYANDYLFRNDPFTAKVQP